MQQFQLLFLREGTPFHTVFLILVNYDPSAFDITDPGNLAQGIKDAIEKAINDWVKHHESGEQFFREFDGVPTIEDISEHFDDEGLEYLLKKYGILELDVQTEGEAYVLSYDKPFTIAE